MGKNKAEMEPFIVQHMKKDDTKKNDKKKEMTGALL